VVTGLITEAFGHCRHSTDRNRNYFFFHSLQVVGLRSGPFPCCSLLICQEYFLLFCHRLKICQSGYGNSVSFNSHTQIYYVNTDFYFGCD